MTLPFYISICVKFFTPGWYVVAKGIILVLVCGLVCFLSADRLSRKETSDIVSSIRRLG